MRKCLTVILTFVTVLLFAQQEIRLDQAKFKTGDHSEWKNPDFNDNDWPLIKSNIQWEYQGYADYDGYAWYRFHFFLPSAIKEKSLWKDSLRLLLGKVDDNDETYLNGELIGKTNGWNITREYHIATNATSLKWNAENVLAVRVQDTGGAGGIYGGNPVVSIMDIIDGIHIKLDYSGNEAAVLILNNVSKSIEGKLYATVSDPENNKVLKNINKNITLKPDETYSLPVTNNIHERLLIAATFEEAQSGKKIDISKITPYILTPAVSDLPKINGAKILGVRPASPVLYKIAATGQKPLTYTADNLPKGLTLDKVNGIISGSLPLKGNYDILLKVSNAKGKSERKFTISVGDILALTPPMGWNSWNCWGLSVSTEKVQSSAKALIDKGLIDHGWAFMNIDDGWEQPVRDNQGNVIPNNKFPDMKLLGDWLHSKGLKFGIYSSPGPTTCGGYLGSYQYELNDAASYAKWGVDYLKYDWCSYEQINGKDTTLAAYQKPYAVMRDALLKQNRDIVFSLCQYGMKNVWEWGDKVNGNCWRTTGDIEDTWESLSSIGFSQKVQHAYTKPGRWSDPDMLIVGQVGWGENLHQTRLNPDEQYTHISLWCLLSAPLLIGCDISKMDDFTVALLSNDEVIAVNQDILGKEAKQVLVTPDYQVWMKPLEDGSHAIGIFNLTEKYKSIAIKWSELGLGKSGSVSVRDLWRQKNLGAFTEQFSSKVAPHGVTFIKVSE